MTNKFKDAGSGMLSIIIMAGLVAITVVLVQGVTAVSSWALPFMSQLMGRLIVFGLPVLAVLALIRPTRSIAGEGLYIASFIFGATVWIWSFLFTLATWGWFAVIIGFFLAGVGVVPIAMLAAAFNGEWGIIGQIILGLVLTYGCRIAGVYLKSMAKSEVVVQDGVPT